MASSDNFFASIPPRLGSESGTEIAPQLESVLRNLNVNLEDELTRYRRQRHGRIPPPPPPRRTAQRQTLDLISVPASAPSDAGTESASQPPSPPPLPPNPFLNKASTLEEKIDLPDMGQVADVGELGLNMEDSGLDGELNQTNPELEDAALLVQLQTEAEGYLESSEELLKSIEEEQLEPASVPAPYSPNRKNNGLLKLAGLVLVLLGGIAVGFAITYPAQLQNLRERLWPAGEPELAGSETNSEAIAEGSETLSEVPDTPSDGGASDVTSEGYKPPGPDLSTQEFKELDNVKDLVTLEIEQPNGTGVATPIPSTLPNPAQSPLPTPTAPTNVQQQPSLTTEVPAVSDGGGQSVPAVSSEAATTTVSKAPAAADDTSSTTVSPSSTVATGSNYYILASYTGDASLSKAREFVPDAFVRNFEAGVRIQLAAFDNRSQAEDQVALLTQQGIAVELFGPTNE